MPMQTVWTALVILDQRHFCRAYNTTTEAKRAAADYVADEITALAVMQEAPEIKMMLKTRAQKLRGTGAVKAYEEAQTLATLYLSGEVPPIVEVAGHAIR